MEPANNYIDDLVRKSFPAEDTRSDDAALWDSIEETLKYKRFLRFSLRDFNIYYSVLIILLLSCAAYFIINKSNSSNTPSVNNSTKQIVSTVKYNSQKESKNDNSIGSNASVAALAANQADGKTGEQNLKNNSTGNSNPTPSAEINNNTEKSSSQNVDNGSKRSKKVKVIKKQVIITDTVRKIDTVYIKNASSPK
jgi:hypothetical protein